MSGQQESDDSNWEYEWHLTLQTEVIHLEGEVAIPYPEPIQAQVAIENPSYPNPKVEWYYDRDFEYVVIADGEIKDPAYVEIKRSEINTNGNIRPPSDERYAVDLQDVFSSADTATFISHTGLTSGDVNQVYLLPEGKLTQLLPDSPETEFEQRLAGVAKFFT